MPPARGDGLRVPRKVKPLPPLQLPVISTTSLTSAISLGSPSPRRDPLRNAFTFASQSGLSRSRAIHRQVDDLVVNVGGGTSPCSWILFCVYLTLTIVSIFGDDFRLAALPRESDFAIGALLVCSFLVFLIDTIVFSMGKPGYMRTFFFKADVVVLLSFMVEIYPIWGGLIEEIGGNASNDHSVSASTRDHNASSTFYDAQARLRWVRMVRLLRIFKLFKLAEFVRMKLYGQYDPFTPISEKFGGSASGYTLSNHTVQNMFTICVMLLLLYPVLDVGLLDHRAEYGLIRLYNLRQDGELVSYAQSVATYENELGHSLLYLRHNGTDSIKKVSRISELRDLELHRYVLSDDFEAWIDGKRASEEAAWYSLLLSMSVIVVFGVGYRMVQNASIKVRPPLFFVLFLFSLTCFDSSIGFVALF